ncbi:magnesium transporter CorA family protein [Chelatococcus composti]|jgi:magnesium transporter|uniref:Magnesium transport protein CorA n=1 Tax=Chelatococcus composti TaxID=1743235 RepID=A0A841KGE4_9HYPH|nr:magnesium transporter CorA family protein [Chelatococcus composti]MBB6168473.1 magnesium transporter [Chelatococcus composti]MBS7736447.1 magnesium transporter CorA family protein [Chelatococcus composti]GGG40373.1 magnesium transporter [Chelatococcus composti]
MIVVYRMVDRTKQDAADVCRLERYILPPGEPLPADAVWIDLVAPTHAEDRVVEQHLGIEIPTREDMEDIEPSELLYSENGARYMTVRLLYAADSADPDITAVTFILKGSTLVTVRYEEPRAFTMFAHRAGKPGGCGASAEEVFAGLIETIIDRLAEILQATASSIDRISRDVFDVADKTVGRHGEYQKTLRDLGRYGTLISLSRESLVSIERLLLFLSVVYRATRVPVELREQVRTTLRDLQSLEEHASFQAGKIQFLLDATLGLVNLEQNNIIKLFSVMAVVFMPPTLIASIYGMNFRVMPELDLWYGYPAALLAMLVAAIAPYLFFRWKRWL